MLEPTKKPPTETVRLVFSGPARERDKAIQALKRFGFVEEEQALPWRQALDLKDEDLPGLALRGARGKEGLTQKELAERTGIPQRHISEMENGRRAIGKDRAKRLGEALSISWKVFLG